jgi:hypothetical protein
MNCCPEDWHKLERCAVSQAKFKQMIERDQIALGSLVAPVLPPLSSSGNILRETLSLIYAIKHRLYTAQRNSYDVHNQTLFKCSELI